MNKENIIIWQKWIDPFGSDEIDNLEENLSMFIENDEDGLEEDSEELENNALSLIDSTAKKTAPIRVMATPMGIIPITENTASSKIFNFWLGHTNFSITKKIAHTIEDIDGVETLDVFTRYRFRIGVGKAFSDSEVMRDINKQLYDMLDNV
jgi:hypothetical protein